jgi:glycosyl transferase family 25
MSRVDLQPGGRVAQEVQMAFPTYVINLQRSADRWSLMAAHLAEFPELAPRRLEAVDGRQLAEAELPGVYDAETAYRHQRRQLARSEIGASLSHRQCYRQLIEDGAPAALVLEDDVRLAPEFSALLPALSSWLAAETPRVVLLTPRGDYWRWPWHRLPGGRRLHPFADGDYAAAYILNRAAAIRLAERVFPVWTVADDWRTFLRDPGLDIRMVVPHCAGFRPSHSQSSIEDERLKSKAQRRRRTWRERWARRPAKLCRRLFAMTGLIRKNRELW